MEFYFDESAGTLFLIHIDRFSGDVFAPKACGGLDLDPWILREGVPLVEAERELRGSGLSFVHLPQPGANQQWLKIHSGVVLGFTQEDESPATSAGLGFVSRST